MARAEGQGICSGEIYPHPGPTMAGILDLPGREKEGEAPVAFPAGERLGEGRLYPPEQPAKSRSSPPDHPYAGSFSAVAATSAPSAAAASRLSRLGASEGWKNVCAMIVGTMALPMTTATSTLYCVWSMMPLVSP